jgi:hypothetical protein
MRYFVGTWTGSGSGQSGVSAIERDYVFVLGERFLEVRNKSTYRILGPDEFVERFELAEPGGDFAVYSEARLKRKR